jgi:hypothetical protein
LFSSLMEASSPSIRIPSFIRSQSRNHCRHLFSPSKQKPRLLLQHAHTHTHKRAYDISPVPRDNQQTHRGARFLPNQTRQSLRINKHLPWLPWGKPENETMTRPIQHACLSWLVVVVASVQLCCGAVFPTKALFTSLVFSSPKKVGICGDLVFTQ